ncbi:MAG: FAD-binding oxidoreductase, partial [Actinobacteria bacterium]|nr:FAD-binding oxidoreductase [Actinomycetota bacterium]
MGRVASSRCCTFPSSLWTPTAPTSVRPRSPRARTSPPRKAFGCCCSVPRPSSAPPAPASRSSTRRCRSPRSPTRPPPRARTPSRRSCAPRRPSRRATPTRSSRPAPRAPRWPPPCSTSSATAPAPGAGRTGARTGGARDARRRRRQHRGAAGAPRAVRVHGRGAGAGRARRRPPARRAAVGRRGGDARLAADDRRPRAPDGGNGPELRGQHRGPRARRRPRRRRRHRRLHRQRRPEGHGGRVGQDDRPAQGDGGLQPAGQGRRAAHAPGAAGVSRRDLARDRRRRLPARAAQDRRRRSRALHEPWLRARDPARGARRQRRHHRAHARGARSRRCAAQAGRGAVRERLYRVCAMTRDEVFAMVQAHLVDELEVDSGRSAGYRRCGTLLVARDNDDNAALNELFAFQQRLGLQVERLRSAELRSREPALAPSVRGGIFVQGDHQIDNRALV